jgi:hypothetical protein
VRILRSAALVALAASFSASSLPVLAQSMSPMDMNKARYSSAGVYTGGPKLPLTLAVVVAGGGPTAFDSAKLVGVLAGALTKAEVDKLTKEFGADNVASFLKTFNFVINDSLKIVTAAKIPLPAQPAPDPANGKALAAALYKEGVTPSGTFDVEYMLDHLVSHKIHLQVMDDIDADKTLGPAADGNYHKILTQAMLDLKAAYKL